MHQKEQRSKLSKLKTKKNFRKFKGKKMYKEKLQSQNSNSNSFLKNSRSISQKSRRKHIRSQFDLSCSAIASRREKINPSSYSIDYKHNKAISSKFFDQNKSKSPDPTDTPNFCKQIDSKVNKKLKPFSEMIPSNKESTVELYPSIIDEQPSLESERETRGLSIDSYKRESSDVNKSSSDFGEKQRLFFKDHEKEQDLIFRWSSIPKKIQTSACSGSEVINLKSITIGSSENEKIKKQGNGEIWI